MDKNLELKRQIFHLLLGIIIVALLYREVLNIKSLFFLLLAGFVLSLLSKKYRLFGINWFLKNFDREKETLPGYGALTYFLGSIIVLGLFEKEIALASIMVLALGDSFCHLGRFGKISNPFNKNKLLEGTIIGIVFGAFGAAFFAPWKAAFFGSLIAMGVEGLELVVFKRKIDDNLLIPVIAGLVINLF
ncbi:hypothetical protein HYT56_01635 [Candidatus Woesearchaeota archaeon]|nr:hypothetical protein [Candidatus Woesearchaeota archaeon]